MVREMVTIQIGQAGIQTGEAFWELLCSEHGVAPDGVPFRPQCNPNEFITALFEPAARGTYSPRTFCIDTDPGSLDWMRIGAYRDFYNPSHLITGMEDAGGCFARGFMHYGTQFTNNARDKIRRLMETCDQFQGFIVFRSLAGGTGSGFGSILMQRVDDDYLKQTVLSVDILPTLCPGETLDPYNVVFALHTGMETSDVSFLFENDALFRLTRNRLKIDKPTFRHANQLIANVASHMTNGLRFKSDLSLTPTEFKTNLVPLPRLKFPVIGYAPLCSAGRGRTAPNMPVSTMVNSLFSEQAQMVNCDTDEGRYISAVLLLRGEFHIDEVNQHIYRLTHQKSGSPIRFVDWAPAGMKYAMCPLPPVRPVQSDLGEVPRAVVGALNNTSMIDVLSPYIRRFRKMYKARAFLHHFAEEGMGDSYFREAIEDMLSLEEDFQVLAAPTPSGNGNKRKSTKYDVVDAPQVLNGESIIFEEREPRPKGVLLRKLPCEHPLGIQGPPYLLTKCICNEQRAHYY